MNIVVLDGHALNPGDLSWSDLESLGTCVVYDRTPADLILQRAASGDLVLTNKVPLSRSTLMALPELKYVGVLATGFNIVDIDAARERGIPVTNVPAYGTRSVAQLTVALILELAHHVGAHSASVQAGDWSRCPDFSYWKSPLVELDGLTLGLIGFGRIGRAVAEVGRALGMKLLIAQRTPGMKPDWTLRAVELESLFRASDIVSLHCPLTEQTRGLVNRRRLGLMKPTAWLINTSRGPLIDEPALAEALNSAQLAGAALDVLSVEPPTVNNPLLSAKNCLITPHIAWATLAARRRLMGIAVGNVRAFLAGKPLNVVNP